MDEKTTLTKLPHSKPDYRCKIWKSALQPKTRPETVQSQNVQQGQSKDEFALHRGQSSKQIDIAKYVSKFLIYGAKMLDKCVKSQKKIFVHCPFLQSQAK